MFAYDIDLTKRITAGDAIEMLQTPADANGHKELLYVSLKLGSTVRELFRFRMEDGSVEFFDPSGETGKRFLTRRPLAGRRPPREPLRLARPPDLPHAAASTPASTSPAGAARRSTPPAMA